MNTCPSCGAATTGTRFCESCGVPLGAAPSPIVPAAPVPSPFTPYGGASTAYSPPASAGFASTQPVRFNPVSVTAFVLVVGSLAITWIPVVGVVSWVAMLAGIALGHVGIGQSRRRGERGRGLAVAAVVIGYSLIAIGLIAVLIIAAAAARLTSGY